jgi:hypothetical protein
LGVVNNWFSRKKYWPHWRSTPAIRLPQTILLPAAGNGCIARRVAFLGLNGADEFGFPQPGVILYPQASCFFPYLVQRHGWPLSFQKCLASAYLAVSRIEQVLIIFHPVEDFDVGIFSFRMLGYMAFPGVFPGFSGAHLNNGQANIKVVFDPAYPGALLNFFRDPHNCHFHPSRLFIGASLLSKR